MNVIGQHLNPSNKNRTKPKPKTSRQLKRKLKSKLPSALWEVYENHKTWNIFFKRKLHEIKYQWNGFSYVMVFRKAILFMVNNSWQNVFSSCMVSKTLQIIFACKWDCSPVSVMIDPFPLLFFSIRLITACFWEHDVSPLMKHLLAH